MPLCATRIDRMEPSPAQMFVGRAFAMSPASIIRRLLLSEQGQYCTACLAAAIGLSGSEVRRIVWEDDAGAFVIRYRVCSACAVEKEVIAITS